MRSFFVKDHDEQVGLEQSHSKIVCDTMSCAKPIDYSRSYEKGKSFNCAEYKLGKVYYNNDFLQDFVIYNNCLYVCTRETADVPDNSENWKLVINQIKGEPGLNGITPKFEIRNGDWYISYKEGIWEKIGKATADDLNWAEY